MSVRWIVLAVLVLFSAVFSRVIAQLPAPAAAPAAETPTEAPAPAAVPAPAAPPAAEAPATVPVPAAAPTPAPQSLPPGVPPPPAPAGSPQLPPAREPSTTPPPIAPAPGKTKSRIATPAAPRDPQRNTVPNETASEPQMLVLPLRNIDANTINNVLRSLLPDYEFQTVHPTVSPSTNALILRGPADSVERVRKLVEQLDTPGATASRVSEYPAQQPMTPQARWAQAANVLVPQYPNTWMAAARSPSAAEAKMSQEYAKLENQTLETAKQIRKGAESLGNDHPQQQERRQQLSKLVEQAFDMRQNLQSQELKQLQERITKVEKSLEKRSRNRADIIAKRVKELLEEDRDLEWNAAANGFSAHSGVVGVPGQPIYMRAPTRLDPNAQIDPFAAQSPPTSVPYSVQQNAPIAAVPSTATTSRDPAGEASTVSPQIRPRATPTLSTTVAVDPFAAVPDSASNPLSLAAGAEQRRALLTAEDLLQRKQHEIDSWKRQLKESGSEEGPNFQAALQELQRLKRQVDNAKRESEAMLKLLELDLEAAEADYAAAAESFSVTERIRKNAPSSVSDGEHRNQRAALRQAEIRVARAKTLLDHHRSVLNANSSDESQPEKQPAAAELPGSTPTSPKRQ